MKFFALVLSLLAFSAGAAPTATHANDNKFTYTINWRFGGGFYVLEYVDMQTHTAALLQTGQGQAEGKAGLVGEKFIINFGGTTDELFYEKHEKQEIIHGFWWRRNVADIRVYSNPEKQTHRIMGKVGERTEFEVRMDAKKKNFQMYWNEYTMQGDRYDFTIDVEADEEYGPGSCRGKIRIYSDEVGTFTCDSTGTLENAFFNRPLDVLAWFVHMMIDPEDNATVLPEYLR